MNYTQSRELEKFEDILAHTINHDIVPPPHFFDIHPQKCSFEELYRLWETTEPAISLNCSHSLYIHIPFCSSRCAFCMYDSAIATKNDIHAYISRIISELHYWRNELMQPLKSLYIGGGTPSLLSDRDIDELFFHLNNLQFLPNASRTFEASPYSITKEKLKVLANSVINRISIGVQSLDETVIKINKRPFSSLNKIEQIVSYAKKLEFMDVNIDLMVGLIGQNTKNVEETIRKIIDIHPLSITIYTFRDVHHLSNKPVNIRKLEINEQLSVLFNILGEAGWIHLAGNIDTEYNVFYAPDMTNKLSRHPTSIDVFNNVHLVGLGASAHGFTSAIAYTNQSRSLSFHSNSKDYLVYRHTKLQQMQLATQTMLYCNNMHIDDRRFYLCFGVHFDEVFQAEMNQLSELNRVIKDPSGFGFVFKLDNL